ncbi:hypothetical protein RB6141 [Rhodopirellula baltica SH 1]|uniref:Uncharacterized protein n=1 Tax=Rhodopirellula baltica (strain DSM 10527 / NCIMB 13988 / SH1) TaxID=243090 RepID=Q7UQR8_RHOBA|nr:hypothetical protein RB6141 [Rhodopirellula baltica SH 1]
MPSCRPGSTRQPRQCFRTKRGVCTVPGVIDARNSIDQSPAPAGTWPTSSIASVTRELRMMNGTIWNAPIQIALAPLAPKRVCRVVGQVPPGNQGNALEQSEASAPFQVSSMQKTQSTSHPRQVEPGLRATSRL